MKIVTALFDSAVGIYLTPITVNSEAEARRMLVKTVENQENIRQFPDDFTLFNIGDYDEQTGNITGKPPKKILNATEALSILNNATNRKMEQEKQVDIDHLVQEESI